MIVNIFLLAVGLIAVILGGNFFVDAAVWASEKLRIPKIIIGATIVSLATTLPELVVSVIATMGGKYQMAAGNAIGSVVANTGLILAISICVMPAGEKQNLTIKSFLLIGAIVVTLLFSIGYSLGIVAAVILLGIWATFMTLNVLDAKRAEELAPSLHSPVTVKEIAINLVKFGVGVMGLVLGSDLLVDEGCALASHLGVSEGIIAVTIVAVGTSLPELVTTLTALCKKQASLSVGNILGANIMDIAFIMPICALISGKLTVTPQTLLLDLPACLVLTIIAFIIPSFRKKYSRSIGICLIVLYIAYLIILMSAFV